MAFAQLTHRESLRDIENGLRAHGGKLYHMGIRGNVSRNTLANANKRRDGRIFAEFAQELIHIARPLHADDDFGLELDDTVFALDASTIDLCLSVFPWALFRSTKSAVKLHALLDLRGNIPTFVHVSHPKLGDVNVLDLLLPEPGAFFVIRAKSNTKFRRRYSRDADKSAGVLCDKTVVLTGTTSKDDFPKRTRPRDRTMTAHQRQVLRALPQRLVVLRRTAHAEEIALPRQRQTQPRSTIAARSARLSASTRADPLHRQLADLRVQVPDRRLVLPATLRSGLREHLLETPGAHLASSSAPRGAPRSPAPCRVPAAPPAPPAS